MEGAPDFWSWRDAMYGAALTLSPDDVYHVPVLLPRDDADRAIEAFRAVARNRAKG
jgi:hypothetical protein